MVMGWRSIFDSLGLMNVDMILELYANYNLFSSEAEKRMVHKRRSWLPMHASTLCGVLGLPDHPIDPLQYFIRRSDDEDANSIDLMEADMATREEVQSRRFDNEDNDGVQADVDLS
ncbi:hypothetical protein RND71_028324 [Anisodus tanguticus]|uniref:Uncharacterized protein n=1 Tax=Anisodus tanguticus TaxID=243964 RepID=A0AAE1RKP7_9SOLA|nr:hypothetical protein RND71_028324 [Anisodus tanguticus]